MLRRLPFEEPGCVVIQFPDDKAVAQLALRLVFRPLRPHQKRSLSFLWLPTLHAVFSLILTLSGPALLAQTNATNEPDGTNAVSMFRSPDDGWLDASGFLEEKY